MYVCMCAGVTDDQILDAAKLGMNAHDIADSLGVGSGCGTCMEFFYDLVASEQYASPVAVTEIRFDSIAPAA